MNLFLCVRTVGTGALLAVTIGSALLIRKKVAAAKPA